MFVNIMDPNIKNKRYYSSDELVDSLKDNFVGQIGMRIMQRPKSDKLFKSEEEKAEFMNRIYIENVWCFSKEKLDYFRHSRRATYFNVKHRKSIDITKNGLCIGCGLCQSIVGKDKITISMTDKGRLELKKLNHYLVKTLIK
ncbi:MAG: hypothetical protein CM15mV18_0860 [uncultured marine virus]|nr:MAG: hypothetical protein CM15mV18_0860 [uncultured marine virus]